MHPNFPDAPGSPSQWGEYRLLVLAELERLGRQLGELETETQRQSVEITALNTKATLWGAAAGCVMAFVIAVVPLLVKADGPKPTTQSQVVTAPAPVVLERRPDGTYRRVEVPAEGPGPQAP